MRLAKKKIVLGVSGGIAAYKACDLASRLVKEGAVVTTILTKGALKFVTPYTFEALTSQPCFTRFFKRIRAGESAYPHIDPATGADAVILAPATAGLIARLAHGFSNDLLSAFILSVRCPVFVCPAMNVRMWEHPATQANVATLKKYGHTILGPDSGALACGMEGAGRLMEPQGIVEAVCGARI
ncbi:MAG TPA: flavoprotein [Planctomycetota bacterium]|nr:flavoprotein [Planctomycetota bacterium]